MCRDLYEIKEEILKTCATNNNDLYKSHLYWSQKPFNICDILIRSFSEEGDVILDPFMGSGVTILQSIDNNSKRKAIGVEINEVPIFIVETLLKNYDLEKLNKELKDLIKKVKELNKYYETKCSNCGEIGLIQKVIFDRDDWKSEPKIKSIYYKCACNKKTLIKEADYQDVNNLNIEYNVENIKDMELIINSRLAVYEGEKISNIFTKRNFVILDKIIGYLNDESLEFRECFKYIVLSILHLSKITDTHSNSQWPLWTPKKDCVEKNIVDIFEKRSKLLIKSLKYVESEFNNNRQKVNSYSELKNGDYFIIKKGSQEITEFDIPNQSVDLVITDPPYLGQVLYSEYMQLYKPFLDFKFNLADEIVVSSSPLRNKKEDEYYRLLKKAFENVSNKLKDGKYMCMYFHDSNLDVWDRLITILEGVGLRYLSQVHIKKKNTLKNIISPKKSLNGDAILFFIKEKSILNVANEIEDIEEMERNIIKHAKFIIKQKGAVTTPELYDDGMMEFIIHNGWLHKLSVKYKSLVDIFEKYLIWDQDLGKWRC